MTEPFVVTSVVEGQGKVYALPILVRRLVEAIEPGRWADVRSPIRVNRTTMLKPDQLERYVELAVRKHGGRGAVVVLLDEDDDCAAKIGPELQKRAQSQRPGSAMAVVVAVKEFEAWFLAGASSLAGHRGLPDDLTPPPDPETIRDAKGWLRARRTDGLAYGPTVDQPALAAVVDLDAARAGARSFDKLWREMERLLRQTRS